MNLRKLIQSIGLPLLLFFTLSASAQDRVVTGRVADTSGRGISGVSVSVKNQPSIGTTTATNGNFSLSVPSNASALVFSSVGYMSVEYNIGSVPSDIILQSAAGTLNEVVIIGYGTTRKRDLTG